MGLKLIILNINMYKNLESIIYFCFSLKIPKILMRNYNLYFISQMLALNL